MSNHLQEDYKVLVGTATKLLFDFTLEMKFNKFSFKYFITSTRKYNHKYLEVTPFSKGGLWKIRKYSNHYDVYYGTIKMVYASNLRSALNFINQNKK